MQSFPHKELENGDKERHEILASCDDFRSFFVPLRYTSLQAEQVSVQGVC